MGRDSEKRTYVHLDDGYDENPKIAALSDAAFRAHVSCITYSGRNLTDGRVPLRIARRFAGDAALDELAEAGLLIEDDGGRYVDVHDYLKHQRSAEQVAQLRESRQRAGSKGGRTRVVRAQASAQASGQAADQQSDDGEQGDVAPAQASGQASGQASASYQAPAEASAQAKSNPEVRGQRSKKNSVGGAARPLMTIVEGDGDDGAKGIVAHYVDRHTTRPPGQLIGQVGKAAKALLADGFDEAVIRRGVDEIVRRNRPPSALPHIVNELANQAGRRAAGGDPWDPVTPTRTQGGLESWER